MVLPDGWQKKIWNVPPVGTVGACKICHGVANPGWDACYPCDHQWRHHPAWDKIKLVVPCTVAVGGEDWYRALLQYKQGQFDQYAPVLAGVLGNWLAMCGTRISAALGAKPDVVTVVPSKWRSHPTPLWQVASAVPGIRRYLRPSLAYVGEKPTTRRITIADRFEVVEDVTGKTIVLLEDTWVTGQTSVSSALALAEKGCSAVLIVAIARMIYQDQPSLSYLAAVKPPYVPRWPK